MHLCSVTIAFKKNIYRLLKSCKSRINKILFKRLLLFQCCKFGDSYSKDSKCSKLSTNSVLGMSDYLDLSIM